MTDAAGFRHRAYSTSLALRQTVSPIRAMMRDPGRAGGNKARVATAKTGQLSTLGCEIVGLSTGPSCDQRHDIRTPLPYRAFSLCGLAWSRCGNKKRGG